MGSDIGSDIGSDGTGGPARADERAGSRRPSFTITDAAVACVVSRKTITRKLPELATHGAAKDADGIWRIPVEALLAVGLHPGRSMPAERPAAETLDLRHGSSSEPTAPRSAGPEMVTIPRDRWDDVRIRLARAEAEAAERGLALADARLALRALTAAPSSGPAPGTSEPSWQGPWHQSASSPATSGGISTTLPASAGVVGMVQAAESSAADPGAEPLTHLRDRPGAGHTWDADYVDGQSVPVVTSSGTEPVVTSMPQADLFIARSRAARSGHLVPVVMMTSAATPESGARKRRWWQSR